MSNQQPFNGNNQPPYNGGNPPPPPYSGTGHPPPYNNVNGNIHNNFNQPRRFLPNSFVNFLISFIPGAGHMYQGLLARGVSLMIMFASCIIGIVVFDNLNMSFLTDFFVGLFIAVMVVIYFFAFFESMKTCRMIRMGLTESEELKLSGIDFSGISINGIIKSRKGIVVLGVILTVFGIISTLNLLANRYLNHDILVNYFRPAIQLLFPLALVAVGVLLIMKGRKAAKAQ